MAWDRCVNMIRSARYGWASRNMLTGVRNSLSLSLSLSILNPNDKEDEKAKIRYIAVVFHERE